jgi:hypothetical protein
MKWPQPTRSDHEKFCRNEGWRRVRNARGRSGTHHVTYELDLPDGRTLRTRISHPVDRTDYGPALWRHILTDQLEVTDEQFWACVREGANPPRGAQVHAVAQSLPAELVHLLITKVHLSQDEIATMTRDEALARLARYWTTGV